MEAENGARVGHGEIPLQNQDLSFLLPPVANFMSDYGWFLLFVCVGVILLIQHLRKSRNALSSSPSEAPASPVSLVRHQEALEASRRRMQEEQNARASEFRENKLQLDEEKRRQKLELSTEEASLSSSLRPKSERKPLRNSGYSPLSGDGGGSCAWRPGRRGPSAGG